MLENGGAAGDAAGRTQNKAPAPLQMTAESILQEAFETQLSATGALNETDLATKLEDLEEIEEFQGRKRTEFEKALRKDYHNVKAWLNYANFEYLQHDMPRVRSIFERSLEYNKEKVQLWIRYADAEIKHGSINHARNLLERAIRILPYADKVWFHYAQLEESLQNTKGARSIFERWLIYEPKNSVYDAYVNMERRNGNNVGRIRQIFERYVVVHPEGSTWIKWVNYEAKYGGNDAAIIRNVFTTAVDALMQLVENNVAAYATHAEDVLMRWAEYETGEAELDRCRSLFKFGLDKLPKEHSRRLFGKYLMFEKTHGSSANKLLLAKRRETYKEELQNNPRDYELWWTYISLVQEVDVSGLEAVYEEAVVQSVPAERSVKDVSWRKYVMLWLRYVYYLELDVRDAEKVRRAYSRLVDAVPHKQFTFSKIWINYAKFEIRQGNLTRARQILGQSIGFTGGTPKIFRYYIELETQLKEMDRVRKLHETCIAHNAGMLRSWLAYAELETQLGDYARAKGVYEIALKEPLVNNELLLWYKYITLLLEHMYAYDDARGAFAKLLEANMHNVKVWIRWAMFEAAAPDAEQLKLLNEQDDEEVEFEPSEESINKARNVFEKGLHFFKQLGNSSIEKRVLLLEALKQFEQVYGTPETVQKALDRLPTVVKKRNSETSAEEIEYKFPEDEAKNNMMLKFLQNAQKWKKASLTVS